VCIDLLVISPSVYNGLVSLYTLGDVTKQTHGIKIKLKKKQHRDLPLHYPAWFHDVELGNLSHTEKEGNNSS
jgi:hypothetical protein